MNKHTPTILVIEDEQSLLSAWVKKFESQGLEVLAASTGESALEMALTRHPDLVVADIVMPSSDGLQMMKKLREDKWGSRVPVIFLSSWEDPEFFQGEVESHAAQDMHLGYDWSLEQVVAKVKDSIKGGGLAAGH